jgi:hypothetical protein
MGPKNNLPAHSKACSGPNRRDSLRANFLYSLPGQNTTAAGDNAVHRFVGRNAVEYFRNQRKLPRFSFARCTKYSDLPFTTHERDKERAILKPLGSG